MRKTHDKTEVLGQMRDLGEREAFYEQLIKNNYYKIERSLSYHYNYPNDFARELIQRVFLKALMKPDLYKHENPVGWIYVTAKYTAMEMLKEMKKSMDTQAPLVDTLATAVEDEYDFDEGMAEQCIQSLAGKKDAQELFLNYYIKHMSLDEIALHMGIEKTNVKSRIQRLNKKLRKYFLKIKTLLTIFIHI